METIMRKLINQALFEIKQMNLTKAHTNLDEVSDLLDAKSNWDQCVYSFFYLV